MKKIYFISAALLAGVSMSAQNLNPTVSVTRAYEGKLLDVHKPMEKMFVPDSLNKFDLDFDYSVFENPYKGAYEFKPYTMNMKPQAEAYSGKKFYLKAGAGYNLRPSVDAVLEPLSGEKFRMGVYASHHSYFGNYKELGFNDKMNLSSTGTKQSGYDMYSTVGVDGRAYLNKAALTFDVGYLGIHTDDPLECSPVSQHSSTGYNAAKLAFRLKGENTSESYLYYDMAMKYRFGAQGFGGMPALSGTSGEYLSSLNMNDLDFSITLGPVFKQYHKVVADFGMGMTWYRNVLYAELPSLSSRSIRRSRLDYYCPKYFSKKAIIDKMTAFFFTCLLRRYAPSFTMFAERTRFELVIPFRGIHAFQACLFSHSSTSPIIAALTADYKGSYFL